MASRNPSTGPVRLGLVALAVCCSVKLVVLAAVVGVSAGAVLTNPLALVGALGATVLLIGWLARRRAVRPSAPEDGR